MRRRPEPALRRARRAAASAMLAGLAAATVAAAGEDPVARGDYLARIMLCADCHSPRGPDGAPRADLGLVGGSVGFELPGLGVVWGPNLTPAAGGAGSWSAAQIVAALTAGQRPDGRTLAPVMPWPAYAALSDADALALAAYLQSLPPVGTAVPGPVADPAAARAPYFTVTQPE